MTLTGFTVGYKSGGSPVGLEGLGSYMLICILGDWFVGFLGFVVGVCFSWDYWMVVGLGF